MFKSHCDLTNGDGSRMAVQRGHSERKGESYFVPYVEPLSDARMKLAGLFGVLLGAVVEGERSHCRIVTRTIDFDGEIGAGD